MKKGLLVVVALLAVASLMAAMAYTWANVDTETSVSIKTTQNSLLAFIPSDDPDNTVYVSGGELKLKLGNPAGLQPRSQYSWDGLFEVKNNSNAPVKFTVSSISDSFAEAGCRITMIAMGDETVYILRSNKPGKDEGSIGVWYYLDAGESVPIRVKVNTDAGADLGTKPSGDIVFMGARVGAE